MLRRGGGGELAVMVAAAVGSRVTSGGADGGVELCVPRYSARGPWLLRVVEW